MTALRAVGPNRACEARSSVADVCLDLDDPADPSRAGSGVVADEARAEERRGGLEGRPAEELAREGRSRSAPVRG